MVGDEEKGDGRLRPCVWGRALACVCARASAGVCARYGADGGRLTNGKISVGMCAPNAAAQPSFDESNVATGFVPESEKSSFLSFVKKAMHGIDLSRITAPPFILAPQSQLETNAELMSHPDVFSR